MRDDAVLRRALPLGRGLGRSREERLTRTNTGFLCAECPSCCLIYSVKALQENPVVLKWDIYEMFRMLLLLLLLITHADIIHVSMVFIYVCLCVCVWFSLYICLQHNSKTMTQSWYRQWPWDRLQMVWFWGQRSKVKVIGLQNAKKNWRRSNQNGWNYNYQQTS